MTRFIYTDWDWGKWTVGHINQFNITPLQENNENILKDKHGLTLTLPGLTLVLLNVSKNDLAFQNTTAMINKPTKHLQDLC